MTEKKKEAKSNVVAVVNQKGGVAKTTTVINLAAALAEAGKRVCVVDMDPQANATSGFGIELEDNTPDMYDVLCNKEKPQEVATEVLDGTVTVLPATPELAGAEVELVEQKGREKVLKKALRYYRRRFDYVLIDCPPSLSLLTLNALVAADKLLVPVQAEYYALEGISRLLETQEAVKRKLNAKLEIFGVLITMYDKRTRLSRDVNKELRNYFSDLVFKVAIPRSIKIAEAPSHGLPVTKYSWANKGASAYRKLAKEVIARG